MNPTEPAPPERLRLTPQLLVFVSSACLMILELVAARLIARHLGNSLYTWTSVIGVMLAGLTLGNALGGRLADRREPRATLGWLFLAASAASVLTLLLNRGFVTYGWLNGWPWPARIFTTVLAIFLWPAVLLGLISPGAAKWAVAGATRTGTALGSVYAWGTAGSIVGTLATGFWLVPWLGSTQVVLGVALVLALGGLALGPWRALHAGWIAALLALLLASRGRLPPVEPAARSLGLQAEPGLLFETDSPYQHVMVFEREFTRDGKQRTIRILQIEWLEHGWVDVNDAEYLFMPFERVARDAAERAAPAREAPKVFVIGGGSYTFPRWVLRRWPDAEVLVAEIDPGVTEANHAALGLPRDTAIRTVALDARNAVAEFEPERRFDLIYGDAYSSFSMPYQLTTVEFVRELSAHLTDGGSYVVNVIDDWASGRVVGAFAATLEQVFPHVYVFAAERAGPPQGMSNFVVVARRTPMPTFDWKRGHTGPLHGSLIPKEELAELKRRPGVCVLTDEYAPLETLIAPALSRMRAE
ncbi:MAG: fused MFS/spermidine synthase [Planctomycetes bacterium]|nr:fused MFS/spermidine synthase [Planctomycetota bacterium]